MITTAADALLADILANPDDDGLRLIYADMLADGGQELRGEWIRLQVARHQAGEEDVIPGHLLVRFLDPSPKMARDGVTVFPDDPHHIMGLSHYTGPRIEWDWALGFVQEVRCPLQHWLDHGPALVRAHPIRRVELTDRGPRSLAPKWHGWHHDSSSGGTGSGRNSIPTRLWSYLNAKALDGSWKLYPTSEDAVTAASDALLEYARTAPVG